MGEERKYLLVEVLVGMPWTRIGLSTTASVVLFKVRSLIGWWWVRRRLGKRRRFIPQVWRNIRSFLQVQTSKLWEKQKEETKSCSKVLYSLALAHPGLTVCNNCDSSCLRVCAES